MCRDNTAMTRLPNASSDSDGKTNYVTNRKTRVANVGSCKALKDHIRYDLDATRVCKVNAGSATVAHRTGKCEGSRCLCCNMWTEVTGHIVVSYNGRKLNTIIGREATCKTSNVVYALTCEECPMIYVGETKQTFSTRMGQHRRNILNAKEDTHLVRHFRERHDRVILPKVRILETLPVGCDDAVRKDTEARWILALNTVHPWGLNTNIKGFGSVTEETDPGDRRESPWFVYTYERGLAKGYKQKKHKKTERYRVTTEARTTDWIQQYLACHGDLKLKYRKLKGVSRSELARISQHVYDRQEEDFTLYQEIASFFLATSDKPLTVKRQTDYIVHEHVNYFSNVLRPERILINRNLKSGAVEYSLPKVTITRTLPKTLGSMVLNYSKFLRALNEEGICTAINAACACTDSTFVNPTFGHIITGDLNLVDSDNLRAVLSKGASYRQTVDRSVSVAIENCRLTIMIYIHFLLYKKYRRPAEECKDAYTRCLKELDRLSIKSNDIGRKRTFSALQNFRDTKREVETLHRDFVIVPVDKASNNFALVCKRLYVERMNTELGVAFQAGGLVFKGNDVYVPTGEMESDIMARHDQFTNRFCGIELDEDNRSIPLLWASVKFHKNPVKYRFIAGAKSSSMKPIAITLTKYLSALKDHWRRYTRSVSERCGFRTNWSIENSQEVIHMLRRSKLPTNSKLTIADFSTLYTSLDHKVIIENMTRLICRLFKHSNEKYMSLGRNKAYYHSNNQRNCLKLMKEDLIEMIEIVVSNSYVKYGTKIFHQKRGIPMGSNCSPILADLCLSHMEFNFLINNQGIARQLQFSVRYIDDIATFGSDSMREMYKHIYPESLPLSFDDTSTGVGHYLDLLIDRNDQSITLFDKRNDFKFEVIRFPDRTSNQPFRLGLNVLYAQSIRVARICSTTGEFKKNLAILIDLMKSKGYLLSECQTTLGVVRKNYPLLFRRHGITRQSDIVLLLENMK